MDSEKERRPFRGACKGTVSKEKRLQIIVAVCGGNERTPPTAIKMFVKLLAIVFHERICGKNPHFCR